MDEHLRSTTGVPADSMSFHNATDNHLLWPLWLVLPKGRTGTARNSLRQSNYMSQHLGRWQSEIAANTGLLKKRLFYLFTMPNKKLGLPESR